LQCLLLVKLSRPIATANFILIFTLGLCPFASAQVPEDVPVILKNMFLQTSEQCIEATGPIWFLVDAYGLDAISGTLQRHPARFEMVAAGVHGHVEATRQAIPMTSVQNTPTQSHSLVISGAQNNRVTWRRDGSRVTIGNLGDNLFEPIAFDLSYARDSIVDCIRQGMAGLEDHNWTTVSVDGSSDNWSIIWTSPSGLDLRVRGSGSKRENIVIYEIDARSRGSDDQSWQRHSASSKHTMTPIGVMVAGTVEYFDRNNHVFRRTELIQIRPVSSDDLTAKLNPPAEPSMSSGVTEIIDTRGFRRTVKLLGDDGSVLEESQANRGRIVFRFAAASVVIAAIVFVFKPFSRRIRA
jgi:hypothetical protein